MDKDILNSKDSIILTNKKDVFYRDSFKFNPNNIIFELNVYNIDTNELLETSYMKLVDEIEKSIFVYDDKIVLNPGMHLRNLGYSDGYYKIIYNIYRNIIGNVTDKNLYIKEISPSRKELTVGFKYNVNELLNSLLYRQLTHFANFGENIRLLIINGKILDDNAYIKLYNPLPDNLQINDVFWISKQILSSIEDKIMLFTERIEDTSNLNFLKSPNFDYKLVNKKYITTQLSSFDDLTTTNKSTKNDILYSIFSQSLYEGIPLNLDYRNFSNFVYYSSAEKRIKNFHYKIRNIEMINSQISTLSVLSGSGYMAPWTGSSYATSSISSSIYLYELNKLDIINKFDNFERYLYFESSSYESSSYGIFPSICWPKNNSEKPYTLYSYSSSNAINWYKEFVSSASLYDNKNRHKLSEYIPIEIKNDVYNQSYVTFVDQVGQILDINYNYIKNIDTINELGNKISEGIASDLILDRLIHFGISIDGGYSITNLPEFILDTGSDSTFSVSGVHH